MEQKITEIERMQTEGAETTFERMENAGEDLPFRSERTKFVVYNIAHSAVSPVCADGARVRILRGFATVEAAVDYAREVLNSLVRVWRRPVEIHTLVENRPTLLRYDGKEHTQRAMKG